MPEGSTAAAAAPDNAAASPSGAEGRSDGEVMTLTEDQKYTGDLILVSRSWPYDFERNSEEIQLVRILDAQSFSYPVEKEEFMLAKRVMKSLDSMIHDCDQYLGTSDTAISSAYRSTEYQQEVFDEAADEYGSDYAEAYVAYPGYSEHHTGLAADLGIIYDDGSVGTFTDSANAEWMAANSYKYGFVRRYAEDKTEITGISNESWHFRYVGIPHSVFMYENNYCLEEYLEYLKNGTSPYEPLVIEYNGESYSVYYTSESTVPRPGHRFDVSGDNKGGYIITVHGS